MKIKVYWPASSPITHSGRVRLAEHINYKWVLFVACRFPVPLLQPTAQGLQNSLSIPGQLGAHLPQEDP